MVGPKTPISISLLKGYPYLIGVLYKGAYMDIPIRIFTYVLFRGPSCDSHPTEAVLFGAVLGSCLRSLS